MTTDLSCLSLADWVDNPTYFATRRGAYDQHADKGKARSRDLLEEDLNGEAVRDEWQSQMF